MPAQALGYALVLLLLAAGLLASLAPRPAAADPPTYQWYPTNGSAGAPTLQAGRVYMMVRPPWVAGDYYVSLGPTTATLVAPASDDNSPGWAQVCFQAPSPLDYDYRQTNGSGPLTTGTDTLWLVYMQVDSFTSVSLPVYTSEVTGANYRAFNNTTGTVTLKFIASNRLAVGHDRDANGAAFDSDVLTTQTTVWAVGVASMQPVPNFAAGTTVTLSNACQPTVSQPPAPVTWPGTWPWWSFGRLSPSPAFILATGGSATVTVPGQSVVGQYLLQANCGTSAVGQDFYVMGVSAITSGTLDLTYPAAGVLRVPLGEVLRISAKPDPSSAWPWPGGWPQWEWYWDPRNVQFGPTGETTITIGGGLTFRTDEPLTLQALCGTSSRTAAIQGVGVDRFDAEDPYGSWWPASDWAIFLGPTDSVDLRATPVPEGDWPPNQPQWSGAAAPTSPGYATLDATGKASAVYPVHPSCAYGGDPHPDDTSIYVLGVQIQGMPGYMGCLTTATLSATVTPREGDFGWLLDYGTLHWSTTTPESILFVDRGNNNALVSSLDTPDPVDTVAVGPGAASVAVTYTSPCDLRSCQASVSGTSTTTVYVVDISPSIQFMAVDSTVTLTATITPAVYGGYFSWDSSGPVCFLGEGGGEYSNVSNANPVTLLAKCASDTIDDASVIATFHAGSGQSFRAGPNGARIGGTIRSSRRDYGMLGDQGGGGAGDGVAKNPPARGTVFDVEITSGSNATLQINWNDDGPANDRSDVRDSGVVGEAGRQVATGGDPDLVPFQFTIKPLEGALKTSAFTTHLTIPTGGDKIALWDDNKRTNPQILSAIYSNSLLPVTLFLERAKTHAINANEDIVDSSTLRVSCTVGSDERHAVAWEKNYVQPFLTAYTTAHEDDGYTSASVPMTVWNPGDTKVTSTTYYAPADFAYAVGMEGFGYTSRTLVVGGISYRYIDGTEWHGYVCTYRAATGPLTSGRNAHAPTHTSTAKSWTKTEKGRSAYDFGWSVYIPKLKTGWLTKACIDAPVNRTIDDVGSGELQYGRWLDIYVPYVAKDDPQRISDFGAKTWKRIIDDFGEQDSLKCYAH